MFFLVEEVALYRRRYVIKSEQPDGVTRLVDSDFSVELPEGFTLVSPIKEIKYSVQDISDTRDDVLVQGIRKLSSVDELDPPEPKKVVKKPKKVKEKIDWSKYVESK